MKTKNLFQLAITAVIVFTLVFSGCKKKDDTPAETAPDQTSLTTSVSDDSEMQSASDDAVNDANDVLSSGTSKSVEFMPCNVTLTTDSVAGMTTNDTITYTLTFSGVNCKGTRSRSGTIQLKKKFAQLWSEVNASVRIIFNNYKVTKVSNNKSLTFNGSKIIKNLTGGVIRKLGTTGYQTEVKHSLKSSGSLSISFDNGTSRTWNVYREVTYSGNYSFNQNASHIIIKTEGKGSADSHSNLAMWGQNRNGDNFYTSIADAIIVKQDCTWDPTSGKKIHYNGDKTLTVTFGYKNGVLITGSDCPNQFKVDWTKGTLSGSYFVAM